MVAVRYIQFSTSRWFPYLVQVAEQIQVENFVSIRLVKAFNERILVPFAGLNVLNCHPSPRGNSPRRNSGPLSVLSTSGKPSLQAKPFKNPNQSFPLVKTIVPKGEISLYSAFIQTVEFID